MESHHTAKRLRRWLFSEFILTTLPEESDAALAVFQYSPLNPLGHLPWSDNIPVQKIIRNIPRAFVKPLGESGINPGVPGHIESHRPPDSRLSVKGYSHSGAFAPDQISSLRTGGNAP